MLVPKMYFTCEQCKFQSLSNQYKLHNMDLHTAIVGHGDYCLLLLFWVCAFNFGLCRRQVSHHPLELTLICNSCICKHIYTSRSWECVGCSMLSVHPRWSWHVVSFLLKWPPEAKFLQQSSTSCSRQTLDSAISLRGSTIEWVFVRTGTGLTAPPLILVVVLVLVQVMQSGVLMCLKWGSKSSSKKRKKQTWCCWSSGVQTLVYTHAHSCINVWGSASLRSLATAMCTIEEDLCQI